MKQIILLFFYTLLLSSCVTKPLSVNTEYWAGLVSSKQFQDEKTIYFNRLGGKHICWDAGVNDFFKSTAPTPSKDCIYPSSKFVTQLDDSMVFQNKVLGQELNQLKVLQAAPEGFVITSSNIYKDQVIYIHRTEETDVVDGSFLDPINWKFYEYAGVYSYKTLVGSKTVHSFKKLTKKQVENASKDLQLYSAVIEYWVNNKLWTYLENTPVPYKKEISKE